jgi:hypothetical protein
MPEIIKGKWDELVTRQDLHGRQVQVIVMEEEGERQDNPWLRSLWAWADSHRALGRLADDSRESIYSGTVSDSR